MPSEATPTPRTDALWDHIMQTECEDSDVMMANHARALERELAPRVPPAAMGVPEGCPSVVAWCSKDKELAEFSVLPKPYTCCTPVEIHPQGSRERMEAMEGALAEAEKMREALMRIANQKEFEEVGEDAGELLADFDDLQRIARAALPPQPGETA